MAVKRKVRDGRVRSGCSEGFSSARRALEKAERMLGAHPLAGAATLHARLLLLARKQVLQDFVALLHAVHFESSNSGLPNLERSANPQLAVLRACDCTTVQPTHVLAGRTMVSCYVWLQ